MMKLGFPISRLPRDSKAIHLLGCWTGVLFFFFAPEVVHAEFLDRLELVTLLRQNQFAKLEHILTRQEYQYREKKIPEEHVEAAYYAFANSASDLENNLNDWVARNEQTGTAHLARGVYDWNIGWKSRGYRYMSETADEQVRGMEKNFALAWQDLKGAAQRKRNSGIPYNFLINIAMNLSDKAVINQFLDQGLQADPRSFGIRWSYLQTLRPWWSGLSHAQSLEAIETFLSTYVTPFIYDNPDIKSLLGYPDYLRAEVFYRKDQEEKALPYYRKAQHYGPYFRFSFQAAKALFYLDRNQDALDMIDRAFIDRPQVPDVLHIRAQILKALNQPEAALQ